MDEIVILDGGFSGQLKKHVNQQIDGDALWTARYLVTNPEAVIQTHLDFLRAGSDAIETNTYQASISGFMKYLNLNKEDSYKVIKDSVRLAKIACEKFAAEEATKGRKRKPPLVVGSIGSYGAFLHDGSEYTGSYIKTTLVETMNEYHRTKINALIEGGVDLLAFETIPCKTEAEVLVNLLKNEYSGMKAWLSFSCKDGKSVAHGEDFQETAKYCYNLNPTQLVAVGINCTNPEFSRSLFKDINKGNETNPMPLIIYPNSGEKYVEAVGWTGKEGCKPIESYVKMWLDMGVKWIGGCCRVFAEDIIKIRNEVDKQTGRNT